MDQSALLGYFVLEYDDFEFVDVLLPLYYSNVVLIDPSRVKLRFPIGLEPKVLVELFQDCVIVELPVRV